MTNDGEDMKAMKAIHGGAGQNALLSLPKASEALKLLASSLASSPPRDVKCLERRYAAMEPPAGSPTATAVL
jgi:hypothetical protein